MKSKLAFFTFMIAFFAISSASFAQTHHYTRTHTRRAQVNGRLYNQDKRIHKEAKTGEITKHQAAVLHHDDRKIAHEEHNMAAHNHGHITHRQQAKLNRQENRLSKKIGD